MAVLSPHQYPLADESADGPPIGPPLSGRLSPGFYWPIDPQLPKNPSPIGRPARNEWAVIKQTISNERGQLGLLAPEGAGGRPGRPPRRRRRPCERPGGASRVLIGGLRGEGARRGEAAARVN